MVIPHLHAAFDMGLDLRGEEHIAHLALFVDLHFDPGIVCLPFEFPNGSKMFEFQGRVRCI